MININNRCTTNNQQRHISAWKWLLKKYFNDDARSPGLPFFSCQSPLLVHESSCKTYSGFVQLDHGSDRISQDFYDFFHFLKTYKKCNNWNTSQIRVDEWRIKSHTYKKSSHHQHKPIYSMSNMDSKFHKMDRSWFS